MAKVRIILIVDDDRFIRSMLFEFLTGEGFDVYVAANGREAIDRAHDVHPDCILMDLNMPVLDGNTAIRYLKDDPETQKIRTYAMSADATIDANKHTLPADGTLSKPFDLATVLDIVLETGDYASA